MNSKVYVIAGLVLIVLIGALVLASRPAPQTTAPASTVSTPLPTQPLETPMMKKESTGGAMMEKEAGMMGKVSVEIKNFAFSPKTLTVKRGTVVTWTNKDTVGHTATADNGGFDTGLLAKDQSGSVTFDKAGTYTYHCTPHPNMKATVVVE